MSPRRQFGALALCALAGPLCSAAHAVTVYTTPAAFQSASLARGLTVRTNSFDALPEGEITPGAGASLGTGTLLGAQGVGATFGENPWVDYFGTPSTTTRLFIDDPITPNAYGPVQFSSANPDVITDRRVLRPVTVGAGGVPLQQSGNLATGRICLSPAGGVGIQSLALSLIDVDRGGTHVVFWTGSQSNPANAQHYEVPAGANNGTQYLGFVFDQPLWLIEIWAGDFNSADGVTIGSMSIGSVPAPGAASLLGLAGATSLRRKRR